jgi:predicted Fe-Mo cluster-binding NifX family protein
MKVAICSSGNSLDSMVDPRFGRCPCFAVVDPETMDTTFVANPGASMGQGAGIQAAQAVAASGATSVVAGNMGPNAFAALSASGIRMFAAVLGTVRAVLDQYLAGSLAEITGATVAAHNGMGAGPQAGISAGPGQGMGLGRGPGLGRGTGQGRGCGMGQGRGNGRGRGFGGRRGRAS